MNVASAWQTAAEVSTTLGTVVALIGVVVTLIMTLRSERLTREGQQLEREQAKSAAGRTEAAAALTEEYTRRVVLALEQMAAASPATGLALVARVGWSLVHFGGDTYKLENVGDKRAEDVTISADESLHLVDVPPPQSIDPGEAITFMAAVSLGTRDTTITVTWTELDGEPGVWKYPLPPRPPRR
jgi:hypothetical protein